MRTSEALSEIITHCVRCRGTGQYIEPSVCEEPLACVRCLDLLKVHRQVRDLEQIAYEAASQLLDVDTDHRYASDPELYAMLHRIGGHDGKWNGNTGIR